MPRLPPVTSATGRDSSVMSASLPARGVRVTGCDHDPRPRRRHRAGIGAGSHGARARDRAGRRRRARRLRPCGRGAAPHRVRADVVRWSTNDRWRKGQRNGVVVKHGAIRIGNPVGVRRFNDPYDSAPARRYAYGRWRIAVGAHRVRLPRHDPVVVGADAQGHLAAAGGTHPQPRPGGQLGRPRPLAGPAPRPARLVAGSAGPTTWPAWRSTRSRRTVPPGSGSCASRSTAGSAPNARRWSPRSAAWRRRRCPPPRRRAARVAPAAGCCTCRGTRR